MTDAPPIRGLVIKADGTVPFDDDCHPGLKAALHSDLQALGIPVEHHPAGLWIPNHRDHLHKLNVIQQL